jgi:acetyl esterase/lipase
VRIPSDVSVTRDLTFSDPSDGGPLLLDVYRGSSNGALRPVVIAVHGGGFSAGSKEWMSRVCARLAQAGFVAMAINYRLGPRHRYPLPVEDTEASVRWAWQHAAEHGGDPNRLGLFGSSAGAMLSLVASTKGLPGLGAVVSWSGIWDQSKVPLDPGPSPQTLMEAGYNFTGCHVCPEVWAVVAAASHAHTSMPPVLVVNGEHELVPASQAHLASQDLERLGVAHELLLVPGTAHGLRLARRALGPSVQFLRRNLAG